MKPRGITNLLVIGLVFSSIDTGWGAAPAASAEAPAPAANEDDHMATDTPAPMAPLRPREDSASTVLPGDAAPSSTPEHGFWMGVPYRILGIAQMQDVQPVVAPVGATYNDAASDVTKDLVAPWGVAPGGLFERPIGEYGTGLPSAPTGFTSARAGFPIGEGAPASMHDGFNLSASFSGTYDSNVNNSPGGSIEPIEDDFIFGLGGSLSYLSRGSEWTFGGTYNGNYNQYLNQTDSSGYSQGLGIFGRYSGAKLSAAVNVSGSYEQGTNRYYASDYVQQTSINVGLNLRYQLNPKTSIQGDYGQKFAITSGDSFNDTKGFNLGLAALWRYSELTEFGPGIRYTYDTSGDDFARTSIGPELLLNYHLAAKLSLYSRIGMEFAEYEDGGSADPSVTGSIGLNYTASPLWGMSFALYSGVQADPAASGVFTKVNSLHLGYYHRVSRAILNLGIGYEMDTTEVADNATEPGQPDKDNVTLDASLGMPVFSGLCYASIFLRYQNESGGRFDSWDGVQAGFSISRSF